MISDEQTPADRDKLDAYLAHRAALISYATPLTGSRAAAEDIVQDAWFRFSSAPTAQTPSAYLYRIVRNLALDFVRRLNLENRYQPEEEAPPVCSWMMPCALPEPEDSLVNAEQLDEVAKALAALPEKERRALEMHRLGGARYDEIAKALDVSVSSAHRLVHQAMVKVALHLDGVNRENTATSTKNEPIKNNRG
ncbi:hypothetical protein CBP51_00700 [Cellvibrio mixtus]|uniref:RNA polymerase subunit sigma-70 n=1 Tax=Cellvibrio mixtus TaxID=39650 RepID=A0A266Q6Y7_9GAMM|nr:sigma-70 family RNA polymerase sigma factor [Cellvibrio mixtus]OZY85605.1 hypothetical protein CBP51_00700 [Cellvibrio mixtus]